MLVTSPKVGSRQTCIYNNVYLGDLRTLQKQSSDDVTFVSYLEMSVKLTTPEGTALHSKAWGGWWA